MFKKVSISDLVVSAVSESLSEFERLVLADFYRSDSNRLPRRNYYHNCQGVLPQDNFRTKFIIGGSEFPIWE